ncbi:hypothetical protein Skr01_15460 [Sphaerisporangium krabiense]|uniref:CHAT domain-containing protein n=1 Tax=Sphaerisporangium krabiense TaxID=763782 RepID=A0A7W8YZU1_9ACTN|nr:CHAT domain-containing protein [Sphaerisporangium krabiense]MBB5624585.1 hypothetical protein [Sphaerisporangium krabiense]GII61461.1 hypothetical protein Skr01_15460 [Sphaerisporangium krabiense]
MNDRIPQGDLLLAVRYLRDGGTPAELDEVIARYEALTTAGGLGEEATAAAHTILGLMLMLRVVRLPEGGAATLDMRTLFAFPPTIADVSDPRTRADLARAREGLARGVNAGDALPQHVRDMAAVAMTSASLLEATQAGPDIPAVSGLLEQALDRVSPGAPGHQELSALLAWARASMRITGGEGPADAVEEAREALEPLGDDHMLGPMVLTDLVLSATGGPGAATPDGLARMNDVMKSAWTRMEPFEHHPMWALSLRRAAGAALTAAAACGDPSEATEALRMAERALDLPDGSAYDRFVAGMARVTTAFGDGAQESHDAAVADFARMAGELLEESELSPVVLAMLAMTLSVDWMRRGGVENTEAAGAYLLLARERMRDQLASGAQGNHDLLVIHALSGLLRVLHGDWSDTGGDLDTALADIAEAVERLPREHVMWPHLVMALGFARVMRGNLSSDMAEVRAGAELLAQAAEDRDDAPPAARGAMLGTGGLGRVLVGTMDGDDAQTEEGLRMLRAAADGPRSVLGERLHLRAGLGGALLALYGYGGGAHRLEEAVQAFTRARELLAEDPFSPAAGQLLTDLARALRLRDGRAGPGPAVEAGLAALEALERDVLLQTEVRYGLIVARGSAGLAREVASWCLEADDPRRAVTALERGRGLVLNAATAAAGVPELLAAAGQEELGRQWRHSEGGFQVVPWQPHGARAQNELFDRLVASTGAQVPSDLRHRVLAALDAAGRRPLPPPSVAEIAEAVRAAGMDALAYLVPAGDAPVGHILVVRDDGSLLDLVPGETAGPAPEVGASPHPDALARVCDWAGEVIAPLLRAARAWAPDRPPRIVLVPMDSLGAIPWHAARRDGRYACQDAVISFAASGRQLADALRRPPRPYDANPVLVADPTLTLSLARPEIAALRAAFYTTARLYGPDLPGASGEGRPGEVLDHLPSRDGLGASLLHLACHASTGAGPESSHLKLAPAPPQDAGDDAPDHEPLPASRVLRRALGRPPDAPGGLVVLSACETDRTPGAYDEALTLATAFLAAGAATVVGSRWEVGDLRSAGLMFMFHHHLAAAAPADALRAAQLWMLDPDRPYPDTMPPELREELRHSSLDLARPDAWAAFTHQGR